MAAMPDYQVLAYGRKRSILCCFTACYKFQEHTNSTIKQGFMVHLTTKTT